MVDDTSTYSPKYTTVEDVPMSGPPDEDFDQERILRAIRGAESQLEVDANGGVEIDNPNDHHWTAATALASYILTAGQEHPTATKLGNFADDGGGQSSYTDRMKWLYLHALGLLKETNGGEERDERLDVYVRNVT